MRKCLPAILIAALLSGAPLWGEWAAPNPARASMNAAQLEKISRRMKEFVDEGKNPGIVTLILRKGELAHLNATGFADLAKKKPIRPDTLFQIMSMTKPVVAVGIMMLAEEGRLAVNDPVEKHLPEFRGQWMVESREADTVKLKKPSRPITIRDLLTHTSGLRTQPPPGLEGLQERMDRPLAEAVAVYSQTPLEFEPGTQWLYSNMGIDTLGRIIEVAAGMKFEEFLERRIFGPLGMKDSFIFPKPEHHERIAQVYAWREGKLGLKGYPGYGGEPMNYRKGAVFSGPSYSLYSTAGDLARFYQMALNGGTFEGKRVLSKESVKVMTGLHTGNIQTGHNPGTGFGLAWEVTREPLGSLTLQSGGTYGHGGAFGTYGWVDPEKELVGVFLVQGGTSDARNAFVTMAAAAVE
jgi:CubicO group peptidase (beta-lactamase class C family)